MTNALTVEQARSAAMRQMVSVTGSLMQVSHKRTVAGGHHHEAGRPWAKTHLSDDTGQIELLVFPDVFANVSDALVEDIVVTVTAMAWHAENLPSLIAQDVQIAEVAR